MGLTHDEIEHYLISISCGSYYTYIDDLMLVFKFPSHDILLRAKAIYIRALEEAKDSGILLLKDLEELVNSRGIISEKDTLRLGKLRQQLEAQEVLLEKTTRVKANQDRIKLVIEKIQSEIKEIEYKKQSKLIMSAENKAEETRLLYICSRCAYKEDGTLFWETYDASLQEDRLFLRDNILSCFMKFYSGLPTNIIREIARSGWWRIRYISSIKTGDPLFGVPTVSYTTDQLNLSYWSNYYQNIYEMMPEDRPSDIVIDDDVSLDAYMKVFYEERNRQDASRKHTKKRSGKLSAFDAEEVIVTRSHELYQDIDYDTPREAQRLKDRIDLKKRTKRG